MKKILLFLFICCFINHVVPQTVNEAENFNLSTTESGDVIYRAKEYVKLSPGFSYTANSTNSLVATADQRLLFPPGDATYLTPNGIVTTNPSLGGVVGNISGSFDVSPSGAATYNIPIECPAGINDMQPNISLVYNSQTGNGLAGWGWNISGLSMISRVPKTYYHDNDHSSIIWNNSSPYALDGNRLFRKTIFGTDSIEYYTEKDIAARIVGININSWGPEYFKVYYKNGYTAYYGENSTSRYCLFEDSSTDTNKPNLGWAITKLKDHNGNYLEVIYTSQNTVVTTGEIELPSKDTSYNDFITLITQTTSHSHRPQKIRYGANSNAGSDHFAEIEFLYETRDDKEEKYVSGRLIKQEYRLSGILVKSNNVVVNEYELTYQFDEYSKLTSLEQSANGVKKNPLVFEWLANTYSINGSGFYTFPNSNISNTWISDGYFLNGGTSLYKCKVYTGDFDGDGLTDFILDGKHARYNPDFVQYNWAAYLNNGTNTPTFVADGFIEADVAMKAILIFDSDSDGKDELFVRKLNDSNPPFYIHVLECYEILNGVFTRNPLRDRFIHIDEINHFKDLVILPGDYDGDGDIDMLYLKDDKYYGYQGFYLSPNHNLPENIKNVDFLDFNGDGKLDLLFKRDNDIKIYTYSNVQQKFIHLFTHSQINKDFITIPGDFNGDGNSDLIIRGPGEYPDWDILLSNGNIFMNQSGFDLNIGFPPQRVRGRAFVTDINNDGKSDVFYTKCHIPTDSGNHDETYLLISNGTSFDIKFENSLSYVIRSFSKFYNKNKDEVLWDLNWENNKVNMYYGRSTLYGTMTFDFGNQSNNNAIHKITNSLGKECSITYTSSIINEVSSKNSENFDDGSQKFLYHKNISFHIVNDVQSELIHNTYSYGDGILHLQGKGFLGFSSLGVSDEINNMGSISEFELNSTYFTVDPKRSFSYKISDNNNILKGTNVDISSISISDYISESTYTTHFEAINSSLGVYKSFIDNTTVKDYLKSTCKITDYNYDSYLNLTNQVEKIYSDHDQQNLVLTTELISSNYVDNGSWCLSKPLNKSISYRRGSDSEIKLIQYQYDNNGKLTQEIKDPGGVNQLITNYNSYDAFGNPQQIQSVWNGISRSTSYTYSSCGRFVTTKTDDYTSFATNYSYNINTGLLLSETDHQNRETMYEYDGFGRLIKTIYPDGIISVKAHQWANGNGPSGAEYYIYTETSGESPVWTWHDILGREMRTESYGLDESTKICVDTEYDSKGRLYRTSEPYFSGGSPTWAVTNSYDNYNRITSQQTTMGTVTTNYSGLTTTVTSPDGTKATTVNAAGETVTSTVNGKSVSYTYHPSGLTKTATPEGGIALSMEYDLQGNRTELVDPDAGTITSLYNGFGELVWEKQDIHDADDQITTNYTYLPNGLLSSISRNGETTNYTYDANYRIESISIANQHSQTFVYDSFDRVTSMSENIQGDIFTTSTTYDDFGRVKKETYPSGFYITNTYSGYGYLTEIKDDDGNSIWKAQTANAFGQLTQTSYGNSQSKTFGFNSKHQPISIVAGNAINHTYAFNDEGNLLYRQDNLTNQKEEFFYDTQNRLQYWDLYKSGALARSDTIQFDGMGNITEKSDIGFSMNYDDANHPHAISSISGNPQNIPDDTQSISYTDFKKVATIKEGNDSLNIVYGVDDQRRKATFINNGSTNLTRYYLGNYEVEVDNVGNQRKLHYISGGNGIAAIHVIEDTGDTTYFTHSDYLGSLTSLTDANGTLIEKYAYGPWGIRRTPTDWELADSRTSLVFDRGYTGHEHLDAFGLINMNGRVYDPLLASFLSPDHYVQAPDNWANYNRYGYALQNPMLYTDPDGEFIIPMLIGAAIGITTNGINNSMNNQPFFKGAWESALVGGITGAFSYGIGEMADDMIGVGKILAQTGAHGFLSGYTSAITGRNFGSSFLSGSLSSLTSIATTELLWRTPYFIQDIGSIGSGSLSGGVSSAIAGGNFWEGVRNGAITSGLNHTAHAIQNTLYYILELAGVTHAAVWDKETNILYELGARNNGHAGFWETLFYFKKAEVYKYNLGSEKQRSGFLNFGDKDRKGNFYKTKVRLKNKSLAIKYYEKAFIKKLWFYNLITNNCKHFVLQGFIEGGAQINISDYIDPIPMNFKSLSSYTKFM